MNLQSIRLECNEVSILFRGEARQVKRLNFSDSIGINKLFLLPAALSNQIMLQTIKAYGVLDDHSLFVTNHYHQFVAKHDVSDSGDLRVESVEKHIVSEEGEFRDISVLTVLEHDLHGLMVLSEENVPSEAHSVRLFLCESVLRTRKVVYSELLVE